MEKIEIRRFTVISSSQVIVEFTDEDRAKRKMEWESPEAVSVLTKLWESPEAVSVLTKLPKFPDLIMKVPATAMIGSDRLHDVRIDWEAEFDAKGALLSRWVMLT